MKPKKWLALFLAAALIISAASPSSMTVMASEQTAESTEMESVEEPEQEAESAETAEPEEKEEVEEVTELEKQPEVEETTEPEGQPEVEETTEPEEQPEEEETTEPEEQPEEEEITESEEKTEVEEVIEPEETTEAEEVTEPEETTEEKVTVEDEIEGQPAVQSLLPLEERDAYIVLSDYTGDLSAMPVSTWLSMLKDSNDNPLEIPEDAMIAIDGYPEHIGEPYSAFDGEYYVVDRNGTIDANFGLPAHGEYTVHMIVGNGKQLDSTAVRYAVRVFASTTRLEEFVEYALYTADGNAKQIEGTTFVEEPYSDSGVDGIDDNLGVVVLRSADYKEGTFYNLKMNLSVTERPDITTEIYTLSEYQKMQSGQSASTITDRLLGADGYKATYDNNQLFVIEIKDKKTGTLIKRALTGFRVSQNAGDYYTFKGTLLSNDGQQMTQAADQETWDGEDNEVWKTEINCGVFNLYKNHYLMDEYYLAGKIEDANGNDAKDQIARIVEGSYTSADEIEGRDDVKEQLYANGFLLHQETSNYEDASADMTVLFTDGSVYQLRLFIYPYEKSINQFQVYGAKQGEKIFEHGKNAYVFTSSKYSTEWEWSRLDSYMLNGYQTIFLNDKDVDLSRLQPYFTTDASNKVYAGPQQESGVSVKDFSNGAVQYTTISDKYGAKNYWVTFVKKATGPKLFVNGPGERDILLDGEWDYHDILIANVGDAALTGLKVELNATHLKLDDYWIVGGEGNDTLAAFTTVDVGDKKYGELANLAKIRLVPDGTGRIEGTLTVSADGQEPVTIKLKGYASGADFTTEVLDDAVKYVPYSFLISNSNMYEWNVVSYKLVSGKLPAGVSFNEQTGEIYGTPTETGEFPISIQLETKNEETGEQEETHTADYVLVVGDNSNESVYKSSDPGYELLQAIGEDANGNYDFVVRSWDDQLFVSRGELNEFVDLWLNGEKLIDGTDYTKVRGSTRITVRSQTFKNKAKREGTNTIAAEFRVNGDRNGELKRTAQNFRLDIKEDTVSDNNSGKKHSGGGSGSGSSNDNAVTAVTTAAGVAVFDGVKFVARVMDANNQPMANATVELHSTPQTALTNTSGYATFNPVEFGTHTFIVKDSAGNVLAVKEFELQEGNSVLINGSKLVAKNGSTVALSLKVENGELLLVSAVVTGDHEQPIVWMVMLLSCLVILGVVGYRKRNIWFRR